MNTEVKERTGMSKTTAVKDHRTRVGAERRSRMRMKLIESALLIFAEKGVDASVIDDVITTARVSRGTFYNYFRSNLELLVATNEELSNELAKTIEMRVGSYPSPTARLIVGLRLYLDVARHFPLFAQFLSRAGLQFLGPNNVLYAYLPVHLEEGMRTKEFARTSVAAAFDVVVGSGLLAVGRICAGKADEAYMKGLLSGVMRSLGVPDEKSKHLIAAPLSPLDLAEDSLMVRSQRRHAEQKRRKREKHLR